MLKVSGTKKFSVLDLPGRSVATVRDPTQASTPTSTTRAFVGGGASGLLQKEDDWIHVDVSNNEEVSELKETQFKLIKLIGALHQRLSALEEREDARNERMNSLGHRVADLDREHSSLRAAGSAKQAPIVRTDAVIADAMKTEHARLFGLRSSS